MGIVDHLKGNNPEQKILEVAFGRHIVTGDLAKSYVTGTSPNHVVTVQQLLGEGFDKGWKGVVGAWFRGINRPSSKYKFYPGKQTAAPVKKTFTANSSTDVLTISSGVFPDNTQVFVSGSLPAPLESNKIYYVVNSNSGTNTCKVSLTSGGAAIDLTSNGAGTLKIWANDPVQGVDTVFDQDTPHSNTAWIRLECPSGSEVGIPDIDTKNNPPEGTELMIDTQLGDIYDSTGTITASDQFLTNPADVIAFGCKEICRFNNSRIDWSSLNDLRILCDQTETPDWTTLPQGIGLTGKYYDGSAFNTFKSMRFDPVIQYDLSTGAPALDLTATGFSVRWEGKIKPKFSETYTFYLTHNDSGKLWINNLSTALIDQASAGTHSGTIALTADTVYDIKIEWTNASGDSQFQLEWQSASQFRQTVPQDRLYPKNEAQKKSECHIAFTAGTNFRDFLQAVLFTCNGEYQDADGKFKFFSLDNTTPVFAFDQTNIIRGTFNHKLRFSQQELLKLSNRFIADGRDLRSRYLESFDPQLFYDVTELQDFVGVINEETIFVGNTNRWQGLKNLAHYAKIRTAPMITEFEGMPQTFPVLPGDFVSVTHSNTGWTNRLHLCIEATDKAIGSNADERIFKLLDWN